MVYDSQLHAPVYYTMMETSVQYYQHCRDVPEHENAKNMEGPVHSPELDRKSPSTFNIIIEILRNGSSVMCAFYRDMCCNLSGDLPCHNLILELSCVILVSDMNRVSSRLGMSN